MAVCPHDCLELASGFGSRRHTPRINVDAKPCYLCMKCPPVCPTGALDPTVVEMTQVRMGRAYILTDLCYNYTDGTICMTCYDRCPLRGHAIVLEGGLVPIVTDECVGCGVCANICPKKAVEIVPTGCGYIPPTAAKTWKN